MDGFFLVNKPVGVSSTRITSRFRYLLKQQAKKNHTHDGQDTALRSIKIGHIGTLDPFASGMLPIAVGAATRFIEFLEHGVKTYDVVMRWGMTTNTLDRDGVISDVCASNHMPLLSYLQEKLSSFRGVIPQIPPHFSAIKMNGMRAYDLARKGQDFDLPRRYITIYGIDILDHDFGLEQTTLRVRCARGTYIRTLVDDIAKAFHSRAFAVSLHRKKIEYFDKMPVIDGTLLLQDSVDIKMLLSPKAALSIQDMLSCVMPVINLDQGKVTRVGKKEAQCLLDKENLIINGWYGRLCHGQRIAIKSGFERALLQNIQNNVDNACMGIKNHYNKDVFLLYSEAGKAHIIAYFDGYLLKSYKASIQ